MRLRIVPTWQPWQLVLSLTLAWASAHAHASEEAKAPTIRDVQRDGTGRLWGIAYSTGGGLFVLDDGGHWERVELPGITSNSIWSANMIRRTDGTVVCLWRVDELSFRYTEHRGQKSTVHDVFSLPHAHTLDENRRLFCDSKGNVWLTQASAEIYRFKADGTPEHLYHIPDGDCFSANATGGEIPKWAPITFTVAGDPPPPEPTEVLWDPVASLEGADGRMWFWTNHADSSYGHGMTIRGAIVYDGTQFLRHDLAVSDAQAQKPLTALARKDAEHLWLAREADGLYTLDTTTLQAERVPGQPPEAATTTLIVRDQAENWLFVMDRSHPEGGSTLWRLSARDHWDRLIDGVEPEIPVDDQQDRPWVSTVGGSFLGGIGSGMWFVPEDGSAARHLDWHQNFPVATPRRLAELSDGRCLVLGTGGLSWVGPLGALMAESAPPENPKVQFLRTESTLLIDARGHLWSTFNERLKTLREWDGTRWLEHPLPAEPGAKAPLHLLNFDARGRVWLRSRTPGQQTAIYDPATDHWQVFDGFEQALIAQEGRHDAEFAPTSGSEDLPRFGPAGRICYRTNESLIAVYDGHAWRKWTEKEITGRNGDDLEDAPFFNLAGRVSVNVGEETWQYADGSGWQTIPRQESFSHSAYLPSSKPPPEMKLPFEPDHAALDNQGTWWLVWQRQLYKAREGVCVPVFKPGEPQPFVTGLELTSAFVDAQGHAFLFTVQNEELVNAVILAPGRLPHSSLAVDSIPPTAVDQWRIRLTTDAAPINGKTWFEWRLDNGRWTALRTPRTVESITLDTLFGGPHQCEARSFDPALQTDAIPAVLNFEVHLEPRAQVAGYIAQLAEQDDAKRKAAVFALARQAELSLPALRAARAATADEDRRWWIDAALQQIETNQRK